MVRVVAGYLYAVRGEEEVFYGGSRSTCDDAGICGMLGCVLLYFAGKQSRL
jgi:hypothetical protein